MDNLTVEFDEHIVSFFPMSIAQYRFRQRPSKASDEKESDNDLKSMIPYVGPLMILLGITKLMLYYAYFNISILSFLDFSEIITSFLSTVVIFVFGFAGMMMMIFPNLNRVKIKDSLYEKQPWGDRFFSYMTQKAVALSMLPFLIWAIITYKSEGLERALLFFVSGFCFLILAFFYFDATNHGKLPDSLRNNLLPAYILLQALLMIIIIANGDYHSVKDRKLYYGVKVVMDSTTIVSDSCNYYIGKTNNYIFIHNEKDSVTTAYPMSRVKELYFPYRSRKKL